MVTTYYYKVWNRRDFRLLAFLFSDKCKVNYLNKPYTSTVTSPENIAAYIERCFLVLPHIQFEVINIICNDELVTAHCSLSCTGSADIEPWKIEFLNMFKISGGKICEQWTHTDVLEILIDHITSANSTISSVSQ